MTSDYEVPYWVHDQVELRKTRIGSIPASVFQNDTPYRLRLVGLSFAGRPSIAPRDAVTTLPSNHPEWASQVLVDIGKSGCSDQNLVRSSLLNLCGTPRIQRQKWGANNMGRSIKLPKPYKIPQDEGLRVEVQSIWEGFDNEGTLLGAPPVVTFIAKGYDEEGYPVQLAASLLLHAGSSLELSGPGLAFKSADLFNNGKKNIYITQLCFKGQDTVILDASSNYGWKGDGIQLAWRVNPANTSFTQMMPNASPIPLGLLTPLDRCYDGGSESPLCYWYPPETYLDPKQALSVRFANIDNTYEHDIWVCMFGQLEVL